ncbi:MAG: peroxiredoxin [Woeseiaceae bacterium]|nr:peroxiredoxin [Woeseiaceae bacterium]
MLKPGSRAPEFILPDQDGRDVELSGLLADGPLILYFYPADFTAICTREACAIRDLYGELDSVGLRVAGISPQSPESHRRFRAEQRLPFTLLSDEDRTAIRMYGVDGPFGIGVRRATFLVHPDRSIRDAVLADFNVGRHTEFLKKAVVLREAAGLRAGRFDKP